MSLGVDCFSSTILNCSGTCFLGIKALKSNVLSLRILFSIIDTSSLTSLLSSLYSSRSLVDIVKLGINLLVSSGINAYAGLNTGVNSWILFSNTAGSCANFLDSLLRIILVVILLIIYVESRLISHIIKIFILKLLQNYQ